MKKRGRRESKQALIGCYTYSYINFIIHDVRNTDEQSNFMFTTRYNIFNTHPAN